MGRLAKLSLGVVLSLFVSAACTRSSELPFTVESLRQHLPDMTQAAKVWRPDAYLETATVRIVGGSAPSYLLSAHFLSPSEEFESIAVRFMADRSVSVDPLVQTIAVRQVDPITESDWTFDSREAFEAALDAEGRRFLEELESTVCSTLILERLSLSAGAPVVWRVLLSECDSPLIGQTTIIDATTGELISRESNFPTPAP